MSDFEAWYSEDSEKYENTARPENTKAEILEKCSVPEDLPTRELLKKLAFEVEESAFCEKILKKTQIEGDVKIGTILNYGQMHGFFTSDMRTSCFTPEIEWLVVESQRRILGHLKKERPVAVFEEGNKENPIEWELKARDIYIKLAFAPETLPEIPEAEIVQVFKGFRSNSIKEFQDKLLYIYGGGIIYAHLSNAELPIADNVDLKKIESEMSEQEISKILKLQEISTTPCWAVYESNKKLKLLDGLDRIHALKNVSTNRENFVLDRIRNYLSKKPGSKVALVYGSAHDFSKEYPEVYPKEGPRLESIRFPDLIARMLPMTGEKVIDPKWTPLFDLSENSEKIDEESDRILKEETSEKLPSAN